MTSRLMLTLPPLVCGAAEWRLPLCDVTALALAGALVETNKARRAAELAGVLTVDPAFAVWTVFSLANRTSGSIPPTEPQSVASIAEWLSPRLIQLFNGSASPPSTEFTAEQHSRFAALVAETIPAARDSIRGLSPEEAWLHPRYLALLTAKWREWLDATAADKLVLGASPHPLVELWPLEPVTVSESLAADSRGGR